MVRIGNYLFIVAITLLFLNGCATEITKIEIIPLYLAKYGSTGKSIKVSPATVRPEPSRGFLMDASPIIGGEDFRDAVVKSLQQTGLFTEIKTSGTADYSLTSDIISQRLLGKFYNVELFLVRYELTDIQAGEEVWSENIFSHYELSVQDVYIGWERIADVHEGAIRDNINQLIGKLGSTLAP